MERRLRHVFEEKHNTEQMKRLAKSKVMHSIHDDELMTNELIGENDTTGSKMMTDSMNGQGTTRFFYNPTLFL